MPQQSLGSNGYAARQVDLEERLERYLAGDRHALDGFDESGFDESEEVQQSSPVVLNAGEQQVQHQHRRQRPVLDSKSWDTWFVSQISPYVEKNNKNFTEIEKSLRLLNRETLKTIDAHDQLVEDLIKERNEAVEAHNALVKHVKGIRSELAKDLDSWVQRKDKQFLAEINELRERTIFHASNDMNIMFRDIKKLLNLEFEDRITKAREELIAEHDKKIANLARAKEELLGEVAVLRGQVSGFEDDLNAAIADTTSVMRGELAEEFVKARDAMRKEVFAEVRKEMRQELARGVKMMRAFRKHRKA